MSDLTKPIEPSFLLRDGKLSTKQSSMKQRIEAQKKASETLDPATVPNRICLMLDCSGSMSEQEHILQRGNEKRIDLLKEAVQGFAQKCDYRNTSVALLTFPQSERLCPLTTSQALLYNFVVGLRAGGGTPLRACLEQVLQEIPLTRGVIVSDGNATDWISSYDDEKEYQDELVNTAPALLKTYKEQGIPVDCVHISLSSSGEDLLKKIASETGGIFMKFTDVGAFAKAFGYLTPAYRAMLTDGSLSAKELGAKEVK